MYDKISEDSYKSLAEDCTKSLTGAVNIHMPVLKNLILCFMGNIKVHKEEIDISSGCVAIIFYVHK